MRGLSRYNRSVFMTVTSSGASGWVVEDFSARNFISKRRDSVDAGKFCNFQLKPPDAGAAGDI